MVFFFRKSVPKDLPKTLQADHDEIMKLFKGCDANDDGRLSWDEVKAGFRQLQSRWPAYRAQRAFQVADRNGDGYISEAELEELVKYAMDCYKGRRKN